MSVEHRRPAIPRPPEPRLDELEALLEQTVALSASATSPAEFAEGLLHAASRAASAQGAALWSADHEGRWRAEFSLGVAATGWELRSDVVGAVAKEASVRVVPPKGDSAADPTPPPWLILAPAAGHVLELLVDPAIAERDRRLLVEIARSFAELAADYFGNRELDALRRHAAWWRRLETFTRTIHRPLDRLPTAYAIANDGRPAVGCDRLSVAVGPRGRILAVSGVETPDRRSDTIRGLERFAAASITAGGGRWRFRADAIEGESADPPPRLSRAWSDYRAVTAAVVADVVVLFDRATRPERPRPIGALVAESFSEIPAQAWDRLGPVASHAELALCNSLKATPGPVGRLMRGVVAPIRLRHLPKTVVATTVLAAAVAALVFVPADFNVAARGRLRPDRLRDVFAPRDGVVRTLDARPEAAVAEGAVLLTLADPSLDLELERVVGDLATARQRLLAVQAERTTAPGRGRTAPGERSGELAAEEKELSARLASLERQLAILERERNELTVRSPIDGVVLTWEADERLEGRPVRRGQRLLTVAEPNGPWILELFVPDRRVGHLLDARKAFGPDLAVDYLVATDPQSTHHATLGKIAFSTEPNDDGEPSVRVTSQLSREAVPDPRPGATVVANIRCGRRPLGYVWFHEAYEAFRTHVWF